ncbi:MAG: signal peptidase II [Rickettsiales bacterium]|jgi:signal peptidase II|nr:signal peptidase II [Rickettsiales bacterium]
MTPTPPEQSLPAKPSFFMLGLAIALFILSADQLCKWWMLEIIDIDARPPIEVTSFFNLVMVWNPGVSFGMFARHDMPMVLSAVAIAICLILFMWLKKADTRHLAIAIGLVIGGALGNVIDRFRFGAVADFFDFHLYGYHWPAFNIADSCIFIGVAVLLLDSIVAGKRDKR